MGCCGKFSFTLIIIFSGALIIYYLIISGNDPFKQELPNPTTEAPFSSLRAISVDPVIEFPPDKRPPPSSPKRPFHTAVTASDSVYSSWQCRIMYYWFKRNRDGPNSEMGGFTRVLHSGKPDHLMDEIPTFVAQPLPDGVDQGYVVLHRPWAFVQWLQQAEIKEDYVLMAEPDHIIVKPIPNLSRDELGAAFPFFYMEPQNNEPTLRKFFPEENGPIASIDPIGNSPVIIRKEILKKIAPTWMNVSLAMKRDPESDEAFGWVLEMYSYAVASALHGVGYILYKKFMSQPPWDEVSNAFILHYTYRCDFDMQGRFTGEKIGDWRFDKRFYDEVALPRNISLPPRGTSQSVVTLVKMLNEATANIPNWGS